MPFDGQKTTLDLSREAFVKADPRTRLAMLAAALRRPLPSHFAWDFGRLHCCAIGLAQEMWGSAFARADGEKAAMDAFGLSSLAVDMLFFDVVLYGVAFFGDVRPRMVADMIDVYLEEGEDGLRKAEQRAKRKVESDANRSA